MNIIIVDDEPKIRNGLQKLLSSQQGWNVAGVFGEAKSALAYLCGHDADVIVTDIRMPETSGLELIGQIREVNRRIRIIILSGYSSFSYAQKAIELGVMRYMVKPTNPRELLSVLRQAEQQLLPEPAGGEPGEEVANLLAAGAIRYVEMNYAGKITLKDMADSLHVSPNYLCELFKRHVGKNLTEYITDFRMAKARRYLCQVEYKISDVARLVGYGEAKYFSSAFKKAFGMTPMEYRNKKRL